MPREKTSLDWREFRIIDAHTHLASTDYAPRRFIEGVADNIRAKAASAGRSFPRAATIAMLQQHYRDHDGREFVAALQDSSVAAAIVLLPDFSHAFALDEPYRNLLDRHTKVVNAHCGLVQFVGPDPRARDALSVFEHAVANCGAKGLKLYPPCGYRMDDPVLDPFYALCSDHGLPVLFHSGPTTPTLSFTEAHPMTVDHAALRFPDVNFIIAHGGVHNLESSIQLCAYRPNVYLDVAGFLETPGGWRRNFATLFAAGISHKIIFGTDWPVFSGSAGYAACLSELCAADSPLIETDRRDLELFFADNISRLVPALDEYATPQAKEPCYDGA